MMMDAMARPVNIVVILLLFGLPCICHSMRELEHVGLDCRLEVEEDSHTGGEGACTCGNVLLCAAAAPLGHVSDGKHLKVPRLFRSYDRHLPLDEFLFGSFCHSHFKTNSEFRIIATKI
jgi:hypothetical protein